MVLDVLVKQERNDSKKNKLSSIEKFQGQILCYLLDEHGQRIDDTEKINAMRNALCAATGSEAVRHLAVSLRRFQMV